MFVDEKETTSNNFFSLECIELHLNITPFEGYPQGPTQGQGQGMVPTNPESGNSKILRSAKNVVFPIFFILSLIFACEDLEDTNIAQNYMIYF